MPGLVQFVHIEADTDEQLKHALGVCFGDWYKAATHYHIHKNTSGYDELKIYWCDGAKPSSPLPYTLDSLDKIFRFVTDWLSDKERRYPVRPDTDGSCNKGWRIDAGHGTDFYAVCEIKTTWIIYGK